MMNLRSLLQDILSEVSGNIMVPQSTGNFEKQKLHVCTLGLRSSQGFVPDVICMSLFHLWFV